MLITKALICQKAISCLGQSFRACFNHSEFGHSYEGRKTEEEGNSTKYNYLRYNLKSQTIYVSNKTFFAVR